MLYRVLSSEYILSKLRWEWTVLRIFSHFRLLMENEEPEKKFHGPVSDLINEVLLYAVSRCNCSGVRFFKSTR